MLLEGKDVLCDEGLFTKAKYPYNIVKKLPLTPSSDTILINWRLFAKSNIIYGQGKAVVLAVGINTNAYIIEMATCMGPQDFIMRNPE